MRTPTAVFVLLALVPGTGHALQYGDYLKQRQTPAGHAWVAQWLDGFRSGVHMYDSSQRVEKKQHRFCFQGKLLTTPGLEDLIATTVEKKPYLGRHNIGVDVILFDGLKDAFPCPPPAAPKNPLKAL